MHSHVLLTQYGPSLLGNETARCHLTNDLYRDGMQARPRHWKLLSGQASSWNLDDSSELATGCIWRRSRWRIPCLGCAFFHLFDRSNEYRFVLQKHKLE